MLKEYLHSQNGDIAAFNRQNKKLYDFLSEKTGLVTDSKLWCYRIFKVLISTCFFLQNVTNVPTAASIFHTLEVEEELGLKLPDWTHGILSDLKAVAIRNFELFTESDFMKQFRGGNTFNKCNKWLLYAR